MYKSYKTELNPTDRQKVIITNYFKVCIAAYNNYLQYNFERIENQRFIIKAADYLSGIKKGKIKGEHFEYFVNEKYYIAVLNTLSLAEKSLARYSAHLINKPAFKKMGTQNISIHITAKNIKRYCFSVERHRIYIPFLGWVRLKEKGYIPYKRNNKYVISIWVKRNAGRYYVSTLVQEPENNILHNSYTDGIGIDLNINNFATLSNGTVYENINKSEQVQKLEKNLRRQSKKYSRQLNSFKQLSQDQQNVAQRKNLLKQRHKLDLLYKRLRNIRNDYQTKCIHEIIELRPEFIAIEDLKVTRMMDERRFSKYISRIQLFQFKEDIHRKCKEHGIELRIVNMWYPSSKICHECGYINYALKIDQRDYICPLCGEKIARDLNASLNLRDTSDYSTWN